MTVWAFPSLRILDNEKLRDELEHKEEELAELAEFTRLETDFRNQSLLEKQEVRLIRGSHIVIQGPIWRVETADWVMFINSRIGPGISLWKLYSYWNNQTFTAVALLSECQLCLWLNEGYSLDQHRDFKCDRLGCLVLVEHSGVAEL